MRRCTIRYKYQNICRDGNGVVVRGATISVYLAGTSTAASVYTSSTSTMAVNSVTSDSTDGSYTFYVDAFDYGSYQQFKTTMSKTGFTSFTEDNISITDVVPGTYTITSAKTFSYPVFIPKNITYAKGTGGSITISSSFDAGNYQVFSGWSAGEVVFSAGSIDYVNSKWFGTLNSTITVISTNSAHIRLNYAETLTANLTIPATCVLDITKSGSIAKASTYTLTINGPLTAGLYQIFSGFSAGDVTFGNLVPKVWVEWWGADTSGVAASQTAFTAAMTAHSNVRAGEGIFTFTDSLTINDTMCDNSHPLVFRGSGYKTRLNNQASADTPTLKFVDAQYGRFSDFSIIGKTANPNKAILFVNSTSQCAFLNFKRIMLQPNGIGIELRRVNTIQFDDIDYWPSGGPELGSTVSASTRKHAVYVDSGVVGQFANELRFTSCNLIGIDSTITGHAIFKLGAALGSLDSIYIEDCELEGAHTIFDITNATNFNSVNNYLENGDVTITSSRYTKIDSSYNPANVSITGGIKTTLQSLVSTGTLTIDGTSQETLVKNCDFQTISDSGTRTQYEGSSLAGVAYGLNLWVSPAFSAGDFTASGSMTWTVAAGDVTTYKYQFNPITKTMTVNFAIATSTVGGVVSTALRIAIPGSKTANHTVAFPILVQQGGAWVNSSATINSGGTVINCYAVTNGVSNWALGTDDTYVQGSITFEVQ